MSDDLSDVTDDELFQEHRAFSGPLNINAEIELMRRRYTAELEASKATKASAEYARQSVRWMFWSVVVLATASVASFFLELLTLILQ